jgi:NADH-ubiquinone oxidoreductase chain 4
MVASTKKKTLMLISLLIVPLIGSLLLLPINENSNNSESLVLSRNKMRQIALAASLINLIISVVL